jgi:hypothetical protein
LAKCWNHSKILNFRPGLDGDDATAEGAHAEDEEENDFYFFRFGNDILSYL